MKLLILGHGRHGKDTVAEIIQRKTGMSFASSSRACLEVIAPIVELVTGETDLEKMYEQRHQHRELWKRAISLYNTSDRTALARQVLQKNDIYVGMRCDIEYQASKHLFDAVIWVDRWTMPDDPTMKIEMQKDMYYIPNAGDLDDLEAAVELALLDIVKHVKSDGPGGGINEKANNG